MSSKVSNVLAGKTFVTCSLISLLLLRYNFVVQDENSAVFWERKSEPEFGWITTLAKEQSESLARGEENKLLFFIAISAATKGDYIVVTYRICGKYQESREDEMGSVLEKVVSLKLYKKHYSRRVN